MSDQTVSGAAPAPASPQAQTPDASVQPAAPAGPLQPALLSAYKLMLRYQFVGAVGLIVVLAGILLAAFAATSTWTPPLLILVTMTGMMGAYFSALTRLYNVDQLSMALITPTMQELGGGYLAIYSLMPPIIGAIAAVVLYVIFLAGILGSGGIFPQMDCVNGQTCDSFLGVLRNFGPKEAQDYGKVFVWAFAAGFSERLVPNTLQSLVTKLQNNGS